MNNEVKTVPSILSADFANLERDIKKIESECEAIHIDIMDGHYVPNLSIGVPVVKSIRKVTGMTFDTHLMITNPEDNLSISGYPPTTLLCSIPSSNRSSEVNPGVSVIKPSPNSKS